LAPEDSAQTTQMLTELIRIVGNTNSMVAGLVADVEVLKTDVAQLKNDVAQLKTDVTQLKTDVTDLKDRVSSLEKQFVSFRDEVEQRFDDLEDDISYVIGKVARQEARILELRALRRAANQ